MIPECREEIKRFGMVNGMPEAGALWTMVDETGTVVAVTFRCPCECGAECYTPVDDATKGQPKTERHWLFSRGPNGVTLYPSIRYTGGCLAHFTITDGKVAIHGDSGK
jgi:hypothetical protein